MSAFDFSLFSSGGPMMFIVLLVAVVALVILIERTLFLHRSQIRSKQFIEGIKNALAKRRIVEALTLCEEAPGPVPSVVKAALLNAAEDAEKMRFAVQEAAVVEIPALERRLGSLAALGQIMPLVGLLGTLLGMITTFYAFSHGGQYATVNALAGGMWQALITTAASLIVAIPIHLGYHFLVGRVRAIVRDVEWSGNEIMQYLLTDYRNGGSAGGEPAVRPAPAPADPSTTKIIPTISARDHASA
ncbi:MAG: MotA/TolQ/ExbB proton channel family protein [Nibricoccus sp.]